MTNGLRITCEFGGANGINNTVAQMGSQFNLEKPLPGLEFFLKGDGSSWTAKVSDKTGREVGILSASGTMKAASKNTNDVPAKFTFTTTDENLLIAVGITAKDFGGTKISRKDVEI